MNVTEKKFVRKKVSKRSNTSQKFRRCIKYFTLAGLAVIVPLIAIQVLIQHTVIPCLPTSSSASAIIHDSVERGKSYSHTLYIVNNYERKMSVCDLTVITPSGINISKMPFDETANPIISYEQNYKRQATMLANMPKDGIWATAYTPIFTDFTNPRLDIDSQDTEELEFEFTVPETFEQHVYDIQFYVNGAPIEIIKLEVV